VSTPWNKPEQNGKSPPSHAWHYAGQRGFLKTHTTMDHLIEQCSDIASPARLKRKFHIIVVYETFVSAARALRACEILRQEIPPDVAMHINAWRIASLTDTQEFTLAASTASAADVVIISTPGRDLPPPVLHTWIDHWMSHNGHSPTALLALFGDHMTPAATASARSLHRKTSASGVDFFIHPYPSRDGGEQPAQLGWESNHLPATLSSRRPLRQTHEPESAFETIENFSAHLRALFLDLSTADLPRDPERRVYATC
jgi:hypothetical protein